MCAPSYVLSILVDIMTRSYILSFNTCFTLEGSLFLHTAYFMIRTSMLLILRVAFLEVERRLGSRGNFERLPSLMRFTAGAECSHKRLRFLTLASAGFENAAGI